STTIITFLMVFLIQNTQNRDTEAIQLKLDELIRATQGAHNALLDLEELEEKELGRYRRRYSDLAADARKKLRNGSLDTDSPELNPCQPKASTQSRSCHRAYYKSGARMLFPRFAIALLTMPAMLVAGCASTPDNASADDDLLASTPLLKRNQPETGTVVEV